MVKGYPSQLSGKASNAPHKLTDHYVTPTFNQSINSSCIILCVYNSDDCMCILSVL